MSFDSIIAQCTEYWIQIGDWRQSDTPGQTHDQELAQLKDTILDLWAAFHVTGNSVYVAPEALHFLQGRCERVLLDISCRMKNPFNVMEAMTCRLPQTQVTTWNQAEQVLQEDSMPRQDAIIDWENSAPSPTAEELQAHWKKQLQINERIRAINDLGNALAACSEEDDEGDEEEEEEGDDEEDSSDCIIDVDDDDGTEVQTQDTEGNYESLYYVAQDAHQEMIKMFNELYANVNVKFGYPLEEKCHAFGTFILTYETFDGQQYAVGTSSAGNVREFTLIRHQDYKDQCGDKSWFFNPYGTIEED